MPNVKIDKNTNNNGRSWNKKNINNLSYIAIYYIFISIIIVTSKNIDFFITRGITNCEHFLLPYYNAREKRRCNSHTHSVYFALRMVGLHRIKKPFSLRAVEFGFSCNTDTRARHTRIHTLPCSLMYRRSWDIAIEYDVRMHSTDLPLFAPSYATSRDRISICCAYMYIAVRKSARIVPLDQ